MAPSPGALLAVLAQKSPSLLTATPPRDCCPVQITGFGLLPARVALRIWPVAAPVMVETAGMYIEVLVTAMDCGLAPNCRTAAGVRPSR
jgi:hypothetical protein